ncbi:hypothetical protein BGZ88_000798 [Linnemannia elongata]|nr:hypothetical protein BGZ88_000798 [Linnemannia elongata]
MTLNRNPKNFFAEVEQVAFSPAHLVPAYRTTVAHHQRDGPSTFSQNFNDLPNYEPQSQDPSGPQEQTDDIRAKMSKVQLEGTTGRFSPRKNKGFKPEDDFVQPGNLYRLMKGPEQDDLIKNIVAHMKNVKDQNIVKRQIGLFNSADPEWGKRVQEGLDAVKRPPPPQHEKKA